MKAKTTIILTLLAFCISVYAQDFNYATVKLTNSDVEQFIKNYPSIVKDFESYDYDYDGKNDLQSFMQGLENYEDVNKIVHKYGYKDITDWVSKTLAIAMTYTSLKMSEEGAPQMQEAIDEIKNNESMTAEQKEVAINQIKSMMGAMQAAYQPATNPENTKVVKGYLEKLDKLFDEDNE